MTRRLSTVLLTLLISACGQPQKQEFNPAVEEKRHEFFVECMKLAAELKRQGDDDVSDAISECGSQSYYQTNYLR